MNTPPPTTFAWPERPRSSWILAGLIFLSLFLHSAAFFLFQAAVPSLKSPPRTAPSVQFLTPFAPDGSRSAENEALLRWIDTEDPALVARFTNVELPGLLEVAYQPSFATVRTPPQGVPEEPASVQFPPARDPLALILSGAPRPTFKPPEQIPQATGITFASQLARRAPAAMAFQPKAKTTKPVEPTQLWLGVSEDGSVPFVFIEKSSGEPTLDQESIDFVESQKFAPEAGKTVTWGSATFTWGDDAFVSP